MTFFSQKQLLWRLLPVVANLLATTERIPSKTWPVGLIYFHKSALLLPIVVSMATIPDERMVKSSPEYSRPGYDENDMEWPGTIGESSLAV